MQVVFDLPVLVLELRLAISVRLQVVEGEKLPGRPFSALLMSAVRESNEQPQFDLFHPGILVRYFSPHGFCIRIYP